MQGSDLGNPTGQTLAALIDAALDCMIVIGADGRVIEWNAAATAVFGIAREQAVGAELAELIIPPRLRQRHREALERYLRTGEATILNRRIQIYGRRADGTEIPVELAVVDLGGSPPRFAGYLRDLSGERAAVAAQRLLAAVVESSSDAILTRDLRGRIMTWNGGAQRIFGYRPEEILGRSFEVLVPDWLPEEAERMLRSGRAGEAIDLHETQRLRKDGSTVDVALSISPMRDPGGEVASVCVIARDISERKLAQREQERALAAEREAHAQMQAAQRRLGLLAEAGALFDRSLDPLQTLRGIVDFVVPDLADLAVVDLVDEAGHIEPGVAAAATDPEVSRALEELRRAFPVKAGSPHPVAEVLRSGRAQLLPAMTDSFLSSIAQGDQHLAFMRRVQYRSAIVAPLGARGRTLGALSLLRMRDGIEYDADDLELAEELARRAATVLDNARLYEDRARTARVLQAGLLPDRLPTIPGVEIAAHYVAGSEGDLVGGDFYDLFALGPDRWGIVIGDVCGKGAEAAALTALVRYTLRAVAPSCQTPSETLEQLNAAILRERGDGRFCTAAYAILDLSGEPRVDVCCAGHPAPLHLEADGGAESVCAPGTLLGIFDEVDLANQSARVSPSETLVFYTDGLVEAGAPRYVLDTEDLIYQVRQRSGLAPAEMARSLAELARSLQEGERRDDLALVVLQLQTRPAQREVDALAVAG